MAKAAQLATELRYRRLAKSKSLALETVFSADAKLEFVGTDDPSIHAARIAHRVMEGGHDVPKAKIIDRYPKSILILTRVLTLIDSGYVYNNSVDGELTNLHFRTTESSVQRVYADDHAWSNQVREKIIAHQNASAR